jgi:hypothetical protein
MTIVRTITVASVAAMLACSGANASDFRRHAWHMGQMDDTGLSTLGVDISGAGSTPAHIHEFLAGLPGNQAAQIKTACDYMVGHQVYQNQSVLSFCMAVVRAR